MQTLWRWHAAEETEHRAVAYDLYQAVQGNYAWRIRWYIYAVLLFTFDSGRQTVLNLWHDGTLFKPGRDTYTGFYVGLAQGLPYIRNPELKRLLLDDLDALPTAPLGEFTHVGEGFVEPRIEGRFARRSSALLCAGTARYG